MKTSTFSLNIFAILLLAAALSLSVLNLVIYISDCKSIHEHDPSQVYNKLNDKIIGIEKAKQKNSFGISDISKQSEYHDDNRIAELNTKIDTLTLEIEDLKLAGNSFENRLNSSFNTKNIESLTFVKKSFEEESESQEPLHELSLIQSSITNSIYQNELEYVELVGLVCKSQSCRVDLILSDLEKQEAITDKILDSIDQNVDYQISGDNGEISIFIRLNDS
jgi:hypothetical protein